MEPNDQRLRRTSRIRQRPEFLAVYERGRRLSGSLMTVVFCPNTLGFPRLGIAATRKIGGAVGRNRAKRRVRDLFRRHRPADPVDMVVIPRKELIDAPFDRVEADYVAILRRQRRVPRG